MTPPAQGSIFEPKRRPWLPIAAAVVVVVLVVAAIVWYLSSGAPHATP